MVKQQILTIISLAFLWALTAAAEASDSTQKQQTLTTLRREIDQLKIELKKTEVVKTEALSALQQSEKAIADANRVLFSLQKKQTFNQQQLHKMTSDIKTVKVEINNSHLKLAELLRTRYQQGHYEAWRLVLNQQSPNGLSRDLAYYRYIAHAQQQLARTLQERQHVLERLLEEIRQKQQELERIHSQKSAQRVVLETEKKSKATALKSLTQDADYKKRRLQRLQKDEKNLTTIVNRLSRILQETKRQSERIKRIQILPAKEEGMVKKNQGVFISPPLSQPKSEQGFLALKGTLRLPTPGKIIGRFGERREEGSLWKGILIEANPGQTVRAIADGEVIFAEWLRGFGNMLIIQHGDGYMSLYGQNEGLMKIVGEKVKSGEIIATVGDSGEAIQTGLYFEIRHYGRPQDPLKWIPLV